MIFQSLKLLKKNSNNLVRTEFFLLIKCMFASNCVGMKKYDKVGTKHIVSKVYLHLTNGLLSGCSWGYFIPLTVSLLIAPAEGFSLWHWIYCQLFIFFL